MINKLRRLQHHTVTLRSTRICLKVCAPQKSILPRKKPTELDQLQATYGHSNHPSYKTELKMESKTVSYKKWKKYKQRLLNQSVNQSLDNIGVRRLWGISLVLFKHFLVKSSVKHSKGNFSVKKTGKTWTRLFVTFDCCSSYRGFEWRNAAAFFRNQNCQTWTNTTLESSGCSFLPKKIRSLLPRMDKI